MRLQTCSMLHLQWTYSFNLPGTTTLLMRAVCVIDMPQPL